MRPALLLFLLTLLAACSTTVGIETVSAADAASLLDDRPEVAIIDVRTPEEFGEGHIAGATMIDFYRADFRDRIAELDRDAPYVIYCRSGNRSGQTKDIMAELGFTDVTDIDGGVVAWVQAGYGLVR